MSELSSFWSRRKAAVRAEEEAEELKARETKDIEALEGKSDEEILEHFGLPDPSSMVQGDDFSGFMANGVPEHLRRIALRTLWRSNPVLANIDGLNEYDDDYRAAMLLSEPVKTAYQVGKGMKSHLDEMARKAAALEEEVAELSDDQGKSVDQHAQTKNTADDEEFDKLDGAENGAEATVVAEANVPEQHQAAEESIPLRRHMRFRFEEASA